MVSKAGKSVKEGGCLAKEETNNQANEQVGETDQQPEELEE